MPGRAVSLAAVFAAAMAVALEAEKAAMFAAVTEDPWLTDRAAATACEAACTQGTSKLNRYNELYLPRDSMISLRVEEWLRQTLQSLCHNYVTECELLRALQCTPGCYWLRKKTAPPTSMPERWSAGCWSSR